MAGPMPDLAEVKSVLRNIVISSPSEITLTQLRRDYRKQEGQDVPYAQFNFTSFMGFMRSIGDTVRLSGGTDPDHIMVTPVCTNKVAHIDALVRKSKRPRPKKSGRGASRKRVPAPRGLIPDSNSRMLRKPVMMPMWLQKYVVDIVSKTPGGVRIEMLEQVIRQSWDLPKYGIEGGIYEILEHMKFHLNVIGRMVYISNFSKEVNKTRRYEPPPRLGQRFAQTVTPRVYEFHGKTEPSPPQQTASAPPTGHEENGYDEDTSSEEDESADEECSVPVVHDGNLSAGFSQSSNVQTTTGSTSDKDDSCGNEPGPDRNFKGKTVGEEIDETYFINEKVKANLRTLISEHEDGIWCSDLPSLYEEKFGIDLEYRGTGYPSLVQMTSRLTNIFHCVRPNGMDWKLFDASKPLPKVYEKMDISSKAGAPRLFPCIPEQVKKNILQFVKLFPEGIPKEEFTNRYEDVFRTELVPQEVGFGSLDEMLGSLAGEILVEYIDGQVLVSSCEQESSWEVPVPPIIDDISHLYPADVAKPGDVPPPVTLPRRLFDSGMMDVLVAEVYHPHYFFMVLKGLENYAALENLMNNLQLYFKEHESELCMHPQTIRTGQVVAAPYNLEWHRGQIVGSHGPEYAEVNFFDYGTKTKVKTSLMRHLPKNFLELPMQAVRGSLANIQPPAGCFTWPRSTSRRFLEMVNGKAVVAVASNINIKARIIQVALVDTSTDNDIHINDVLVEEGLAEFGVTNVSADKVVYTNPYMRTFQAGEEMHTDSVQADSSKKSIPLSRSSEPLSIDICEAQSTSVIREELSTTSGSVAIFSPPLSPVCSQTSQNYVPTTPINFNFSNSKGVLSPVSTPSQQTSPVGLATSLSPASFTFGIPKESEACDMVSADKHKENVNSTCKTEPVLTAAVKPTSLDTQGSTHCESRNSSQSTASSLCFPTSSQNLGSQVPMSFSTPNFAGISYPTFQNTLKINVPEHSFPAQNATILPNRYNSVNSSSNSYLNQPASVWNNRGFLQNQFPQGQFPQGQFPQGQFPQGQFPQSQFPQNQFPQNQFPLNSTAPGQNLWGPQYASSPSQGRQTFSPNVHQNQWWIPHNTTNTIPVPGSDRSHVLPNQNVQTFPQNFNTFGPQNSPPAFQTQNAASNSMLSILQSMSMEEKMRFHYIQKLQMEELLKQTIATAVAATVPPTVLPPQAGPYSTTFGTGLTGNVTNHPASSYSGFAAQPVPVTLPSSAHFLRNESSLNPINSEIHSTKIVGHDMDGRGGSVGPSSLETPAETKLQHKVPPGFEKTRTVKVGECETRPQVPMSPKPAVEQEGVTAAVGELSNLLKTTTLTMPEKTLSDTLEQANSVSQQAETVKVGKTGYNDLNKNIAYLQSSELINKSCFKNLGESTDRSTIPNDPYNMPQTKHKLTEPMFKTDMFFDREIVLAADSNEFNKLHENKHLFPETIPKSFIECEQEDEEFMGKDNILEKFCEDTPVKLSSLELIPHKEKDYDEPEKLLNLRQFVKVIPEHDIASLCSHGSTHISVQENRVVGGQSALIKTQFKPEMKSRPGEIEVRPHSNQQFSDTMQAPSVVNAHQLPLKLGKPSKPDPSLDMWVKNYDLIRQLCKPKYHLVLEVDISGKKVHLLNLAKKIYVIVNEILQSFTHLPGYRVLVKLLDSYELNLNIHEFTTTTFHTLFTELKYYAVKGLVRYGDSQTGDILSPVYCLMLQDLPLALYVSQSLTTGLLEEIQEVQRLYGPNQSCWVSK